MKQRLLTALVLAALAAAAQAKLPAPDDAAKAKAAETTARAAWQAKVDAYQLCKAQDKVAAKYKSGAGKDAKAVPVVAKAASAPAAAKAASAPVAAASAPGTPVATASTPPVPCADPGVFAYNPPEQKPLEAAGAHSPTGTAASPPSVRAESATMTPAKPSTAPAGGASAAKKS
jgi:hypothetical protein